MIRVNGVNPRPAFSEAEMLGGLRSVFSSVFKVLGGGWCRAPSSRDKQDFLQGLAGTKRPVWSWLEEECQSPPRAPGTGAQNPGKAPSLRGLRRPTGETERQDGKRPSPPEPSHWGSEAQDGWDNSLGACFRFSSTERCLLFLFSF